MSDPSNDIDALTEFLRDGSDFGCECGSETAKRHLSALTALVAERNALKSQVLELAWKLDGEQENRNALKRRVDELEDEQVESDRDLRERLMCAALTGILSNSDFNLGEEESGSWVVRYADAAIAAMRKGESDGT